MLASIPSHMQTAIDRTCRLQTTHLSILLLGLGRHISIHGSCHEQIAGGHCWLPLWFRLPAHVPTKILHRPWYGQDSVLGLATLTQWRKSAKQTQTQWIWSCAEGTPELLRVLTERSL